MNTAQSHTATATFAIFTTDGPGNAPGRLEYVTQARNEEHALEIFADDVMSSDRSVEAGWEWAIFEIPVGIAEDDEAIYEHVSDQFPARLKTPTS